MPELPEVETIARELKEKVLSRTFLDIWIDAPKLIKKPKNLTKFKKELIGRKITNISRMGKIIVFDLSQDMIMFVHQKMTGHFLIGKWNRKGKQIIPAEKGFLRDSANKYIHIIFYLDKGKQLAFSDLRKFARIELLSRKDFEKFKKELNLGPDSLEKNFSLDKFSKIISSQKGKIKQVLMNQKIISGIGNIYSDEALFEAKINPFRPADSLSKKELQKLLIAIKMILRKSIKAGGDSVSDYRRTDGSLGEFDKLSKVYAREGEKCLRCKSTIKREKMGGRSTHFCPKCQI